MHVLMNLSSLHHLCGQPECFSLRLFANVGLRRFQLLNAVRPVLPLCRGADGWGIHLGLGQPRSRGFRVQAATAPAVEEAGVSKADETPKVKPRPTLGAFQNLPTVSPAAEILGSGLRRALRTQATKGLRNVLHRERSRAAKTMDALTKELAMPLGRYIRLFPTRGQLHPFECALLDLTLEEGTYDQTLAEVDRLRKNILVTGKEWASRCNQAVTKKEAEANSLEGVAALESMFQKRAASVDALKEVAKTLRRMPVVNPKAPTLCLVGAPNVGKSSLVRVLSSGVPEVCNYPFTTRSISMGHFFVEGRRHQVTDTPGLLNRPDDQRNRLERLSLAALSHLPVAVLFVHDLTGLCGSSVHDQMCIYQELKEKFADRPWIDVVSKAELLKAPEAQEPGTSWESQYPLVGPPGALRVSIISNEGIDELTSKVYALLADNDLTSGGSSQGDVEWKHGARTQVN